MASSSSSSSSGCVTVRISLRSLLNGSASVSKPLVDSTLRLFHTMIPTSIDCDFLAFSKQALLEGRHTLKLYTIMCWLVFSQESRAFMNKSDGEDTMNRFYRMLTRGLLFVLHGLKPNGGVFKEEKNLIVMRKLDFFVINMMTVYGLL